MPKNKNKDHLETKKTEHKKKDDKFSKEIEKLKTEREEYLEGWQKERADFSNYKKGEEERFKEVRSFSNERLIKSLITILDSFNLALQSFTRQAQEEEQNENYIKGIALIKSQLEDILQKEGVEIIIANPRDVFDPTYHEAIMEVEKEGFDSHVIVEMLEKGYLLNGKLIRPCRVLVAKDIKKQ
ncbi:MAG: nucleotide exchange factor GrpE [Candidatus Pacebacteria bacterium]|jgi:molecular chaperone GrpE|nr:nucleotide exchange factor GrpE [Candidatus Paceibacterota bacterium]